MTQKAVIAAVRAMGLSCGRTDHGDYRINLLKREGGNEDTAYYTDDAEDAVATAQAMAMHRGTWRMG